MESHSSAYCFDPEAYVERYYSGHYPNKVEERIVEWMKENIHNIFAEGYYEFTYNLHHKRESLIKRKDSI